MEGTVLRVPCIPSNRWRVFWRSSVRGPGPPGANCSRFSDRRRRAGGGRLPANATVMSLWERPDPFWLRVARPGARTRCRPFVAKCSTGVRGTAPPPVGNAGEAPAPILSLAAHLTGIVFNDTSGRRDVSTTSWDELGRLQSSQTSSIYHLRSRPSLSWRRANQEQRDVPTTF